MTNRFYPRTGQPDAGSEAYVKRYTISSVQTSTGFFTAFGASWTGDSG
jgi:hypothetical protein